MSPLLALLFAPPAPTDEIAFRTLAFGSNGQIKDGGAIVMRSEADFDRYRKSMGTADQKRPAIDWGTEEVVALHAAGIGYGASSLQVVKVRRRPDGGLDIDAALDRGNVPASPTPGVTPVLKKQGLYALIAVPSASGTVNLRMVEAKARVGDKSDTVGSP